MKQLRAKTGYFNKVNAYVKLFMLVEIEKIEEKKYKI